MINLENCYKGKLKGKVFIDLFCGLGGLRLALESYGASCAFSSDIDKDIPSHNILCASFPCQAFSISEKQMGFDDTRGILFKEVVRIAEE